MATSDMIHHEYAADDVLARQIKIWQENESIHLISNAMPSGVLVLNEYRQTVFANDLFLKAAKVDSFDEIAGKRPGNILGCINADIEKTGCGSSLFCKNCGALKAVISSLMGNTAIEECYLERKQGLQPLELRVKTTPIEMNGEKFTIFAIEDIHVEKERDSLMQQLKEMSETDELTGLHNRRYLYQEAERELARVDRYRHPLSLFMIDIDHFKQVNDTYGHLIGDDVLANFAQVLRKSLREVDLITRWGGEEFAVLLPESNIEQAFIASNRLQKNVEKMRIPTDQGELSITISIGATGLYGNNHATFDELIKEADDALYLAKERGRNCVVHWGYHSY